MTTTIAELCHHSTSSRTDDLVSDEERAIQHTVRTFVTWENPGRL
ncbi:hypothetical protein ACFWA5_47945 [Streptomyces mirabilis]